LEKKKAADPKFGTGKNTGEIDGEADRKYIAALDCGKLKPYENYDDLIDCVVYNFGRYWLCRGRQEITLTKWSFIQFGIYKSGPDEGLGYARLNILDGIYKTMKWSLKNPIIKKTKSHVEVRDNPEDPYSAYKILKHLRSVCPEHQERVFCRKMSRSQEVERKISGSLTQSNSKMPIGVNTISLKCKTVAQICGFENWPDFTNHWSRALGITTLSSAQNNVPEKQRLDHARHSSMKSQLPYQRANQEANHQLQIALLGPHAKKPQPQKKLAPPVPVAVPPPVALAPPEEALAVSVPQSLPVMPALASLPLAFTPAAKNTTKNLPAVTPAAPQENRNNSTEQVARLKKQVSIYKRRLQQADDDLKKADDDLEKGVSLSKRRLKNSEDELNECQGKLKSQKKKHRREIERLTEENKQVTKELGRVETEKTSLQMQTNLQSQMMATRNSSCNII
jgi:hypothetical protein